MSLKGSIDIPFNRPCFVGKEIEYMSEAIERGHVSGDGHFSAMCSELLEQELRATKVLLTTSCTHALEMAGHLLELKPGDEVIIPSYTFVSTANAFALRGVRIVFCDIRLDTLNIDENLLDGLVTSRTRAVVPVHYAGVGCEMGTIMELAAERGLDVVEDNAHGLFGKYKGSPLGSFGRFSTLSFHETKNIICGEGGALVVNDPDFIERAEIIREKGTDRSRMFRGEVDKYTWVDIGSSYLPSDLLAAFLCAQLEERQGIQLMRKRIWQTYREALKDWAGRHEVGLPVVPSHCEHPYHMFYMVMPSENYRHRMIEHLKSRGILAVFHYLPLHLSKMGKKMGAGKGDCPVAEDISGRVLRLPFYNHLSETDQERVIESVLEFDWNQP